MRATFAIGRVQAGEQRVLWLAPAPPRTFPGPWTVRAAVTRDRASALVSGSTRPAPERRERRTSPERCRPAVQLDLAL